jgi:beta-RFAP synthase
MGHNKTVRIETGARIHFGLLDTVPPFGGLGVMIDTPPTVMEFSWGDRFRADQAIHGRAVRIATLLDRRFGRPDLPPVSIRLLQSAPRHSGFGSGTQLSLAIAEGICQMTDVAMPDEILAREVAERGKRSVVGIHGYYYGGLIYEAADEEAEGLNPIQRLVTLPDRWRVLLLRPISDGPTISGRCEMEQFARLDPNPAGRDALQVIAEETLLPAAESKDFDRFAAAVQHYNRTSGMLFAEVQGGPYNGPVVTELIESLKAEGVSGVGQSSWGPGIFVWCRDESQAHDLADRFGNETVDVQIAKVQPHGRRITIQG